MAHRATVYTVRVRPKGKPTDWLPLGDIDDAGTSLIDALAGMLHGIEASDNDESRNVVVRKVRQDGSELFVTIMHGQTNMVADIVDKQGDLRLRQTVDDTSRVKCACLMRLPLNEDMGFLGTHVNNGRAIKGLLEKGILARFREQHPQLLLVIKPFIEGSVFEQAIEAGRIRQLKLQRIERSDDRAERGLGKWIESGTEAKITLSLSARARAAHLRARLPLRVLQGDDRAIGQILEYDGQHYDEAKLQVMLADGQKRTFTIGEPDSGNAIAEDLHNLVTRDGEPTDASLRSALQEVLDHAIAEN